MKSRKKWNWQKRPKNGLRKKDLDIIHSCAFELFLKAFPLKKSFSWSTEWHILKNATAYTESTKGNHKTYVNPEFFSSVENPLAEMKNTLLHELIHVYIFEKTGKADNHNAEFELARKKLNTILKFEAVKKERVIDKNGRLINPIKNPSRNNEAVKKATALFESFMHYAPKKIKDLKIPLGPDAALACIGSVENLEYISDKMIFKNDKKTRKRKHRTYIHNFSEHNKSPYLFSNELGNILIIFDPRNEIEVRAEGIV